MRDPTDVLTTIAYKVMEHQKTPPSGWSLRDEMKLFVNPDVQCPNCEEWIPTNRVWLVDNKYRFLRGCWDMKGNPIDKYKVIVHPHVYDDDNICMGKCTKASEALFTGVAAGTHYQNTEIWFWMIGHECPMVSHRDCADCRLTHPGDIVVIHIGPDDSRLNLCKGIKEYRCTSCEKWFRDDEINGDDGQCSSCYESEESQIFYCACDYGCGCENEIDQRGFRCEVCTELCNDPDFYCSCDRCDCTNTVDDEEMVCGPCDNHEPEPVEY